jgi:hypothetical protein
MDGGSMFSNNLISRVKWGLVYLPMYPVAVVEMRKFNRGKAMCHNHGRSNI